MSKIKTKKKTKTKKKKAGFIAPEFKELENKILKIPKNIRHYRCRTFLLFLLHTGVRVSEAISLKISNINFKTDTIKIKLQKAKKIKEREIIMSPLLHKELYEYIKSNNLKPHQQLFKMNRKTAYTIAKNHLNLHPHSLRHSFAVHLLKKKIPLDYIRRLLGHSSYEVIKQYLRYSTFDIKDEIQKALSE